MLSTTVTYANMKTFVRDHMWEGFTETDTRKIDEAIAGGIRELARSRQWSFLQQQTVIQTVAAVSFNATITNGATTLTASASTFAAGDVGKFVELNGQERLYRIASFTSDTVVEIERAYVGTTLSAAASFMVVLDYDLPTDFRSLISLTTLDDNPVAPVDMRQMEMLHINNVGQAQPTVYTLGYSPDDGKRIIRFFQQPDAVYEYLLWYNAIPQADGYADGSYIEWPDDHMHVLKAAILKTMAENGMLDPNDINVQIRKAENLIAQARADDSLHRRKRRLAGGRKRRKGGLNSRGHYAETDVTWSP